MGPLSLDLRERVVTAIREENMSCRAAARQFNFSYASAIRWAQATVPARVSQSCSR